MPATIDRRVRFLAWASLASQVVIVVTGGAVRLTASGLGCPTWPKCTPDSLVNTPEMGIHGVIEFTNRMLTFVLVIVAIAMFLSVLRMRRERPDLFRLSLFIGLGIPAQAVIGGISVLTQLNPYVVGLHFVVSVVLVAIATVLVYRVYRGRRGSARTAPTWFAGLAHTTAFVVALTILVGIVTTGSGPHAGDADAPRNGLDSELLQHLHSWPAYVTFALTIALVVAAARLRLTSTLTFAVTLLTIESAQIVVGLAQARLGLPEILVALHMLLACLLASAMTAVVLSLRQR
jgi:cytochrome c oxidase assembly protein subunit 15